MKPIIFRVSKRVYIVFGIMFGGIPILLILISFFLKEADLNLKQDLIFFSLWLIPLIFSYAMFAIYKITYDNNQIKYRGLFGTKIINIRDIKRYKIKSTVDATKPTVGLYLDTVNKKSEIVIPANLFTSQSLNDLMNHINTINGSAKGKANAGKSVFSYRKKKKV